MLSIKKIVITTKVNEFYCAVCKHQYVNTTMEKHKVTKIHHDNLFKSKGCLL